MNVSIEDRLDAITVQVVSGKADLVIMKASLASLISDVALILTQISAINTKITLDGDSIKVTTPGSS